MNLSAFLATPPTSLGGALAPGVLPRPAIGDWGQQGRCGWSLDRSWCWPQRLSGPRFPSVHHTEGLTWTRCSAGRLLPIGGVRSGRTGSSCCRGQGGGRRLRWKQRGCHPAEGTWKRQEGGAHIREVRCDEQNDLGVPNCCGGRDTCHRSNRNALQQPDRGM